MAPRRVVGPDEERSRYSSDSTAMPPRGGAAGKSHQTREVIMEILWAIIIGFIVGLLARMIMPGRDPGGILVTTLIGIAGALIATFLGRAMGWYGTDQSAGFLASIVGAIVLLAVFRMFRGRRATA
jgi:uncharacterized membrane protein YeaQ/YmgE (transglycosylase-associated protein family)